MGLWVSCNTCHDQLWQTTFYQPPHESIITNPVPGKGATTGYAGPASGDGDYGVPLRRSL